MSTQIATTQHSCSMCDTSSERTWAQLAHDGWRSNYAGFGLEAIKLCPGCNTIIENRRRVAASLEASL
jgi:hypothetical protein